MNDFDKIIEIANQNNHMFQTNMIVEAGIRKERIREMIEEQKIKRIGRGHYILADSFIDPYFELQSLCPKGIFSYQTAAYLWGLISEPGSTIECTFPRGYHPTTIEIRKNTKFHYVTDERYSIGITDKTTPFGTRVRLYDKERIVCDFIKNKARCDIQIWGTVLNAYFRSHDKNIKNLIKYAKFYGILDELEMYVELLQ